ncbi:MAG: YqiJ family protein [Beijerinckiaceae bacterium]|nr:YqiJ family protein [Beijerinckiaceae bacterium]
MLAVLSASESIIFVSALILMMLIGVVQVIGLGGQFGLDTHVDVDTDADIDLLGWLGVGTLPLMIVIVVLLALFGTIGLIIEQVSHDIFGAMVSPLIAAPASLLISLPLTGLSARGLARILPRDFTTAVSLDTLVGESGRILTGRARQGSPAKARVEDAHGQAHFVMVEPNTPDQTLEEGEIILLVRREDTVFFAISRGDHRLPQLGV